MSTSIAASAEPIVPTNEVVNHEIMNLNGQDKYVKEKYLNNYQLLGKILVEIYSSNSELGRWLRTKNILEKIGNNLFVHGGISPAVNRMHLSIEEINTLARPYYDQSKNALKESDSNLNTLFNERKSPFWYRQYYTEDYFSQSNRELIYHATEGQLDSTQNSMFATSSPATPSLQTPSASTMVAKSSTPTPAMPKAKAKHY